MTLSTAATSTRTPYENDAERFVPKKRNGLSRLFSCCCASDEEVDRVERATVAVLGSGERLSPRSAAPAGHGRHDSGSGRALLQGASVVKHGSMDSATHHLVARSPSPDQTLLGVVQEDEIRLARELSASQGGLNDSVVSAGVVLGDVSSVNATADRSFATTFLSRTPTPGPGAAPQVTPPGSGDHPLLSATPSGSTVDAGNVTGNNRSPFSVGSTSSSGSRSTGGTPTIKQGDGSTVANRLLFAGNQ